MLHHRRPAVFLSVFTAGLLAFTPPAGAGCLCDWLFGHPAPTYAAAYPVAVAAPYAAAYPVAVAAPYAAAYPVAAAAPYAAAYPTAAAAPYAAAYPTTVGAPPAAAANGAVQTSYYAAPAATAAAMPTAPAPVSTPPYAAQMPPYGAAPVAAAPTAYGAYYGSAAAAPVAAPQTSFYGNGNIYPETAVSYAAAYPPAMSAPVTNVAPLFAPQPVGGLLGGVGRFFGSLFGTRYQTSYYAAPVTYYRPATTVDPASGSAVVTQQPCTSYQYQVQRSPYSSLQPGYAAAPQPTYQPSYGCVGTALPSSSDVAPTPYVPQPTLPPAGFDPYAAQSPAPVGSGYNGYSNGVTAPLSGPPAAYGAPAAGNQPSDINRVDQPQLDASGMPINGASAARPTWMQHPYSSSSSSSPAAPAAAAPSHAPAVGSDALRPIPAPPGYHAEPLRPTTSVDDRTASRGTWDYKTVQWRTASAAAPARRITEPRIAEPRIAEPRIAEPRIAEPRIAEPRIAEPRIAEPADRGWQLDAPVVAPPRRSAAAPALPARPATPVVRDNSGWKPVR